MALFARDSLRDYLSHCVKRGRSKIEALSPAELADVDRAIDLVLDSVAPSSLVLRTEETTRSEPKEIVQRVNGVSGHAPMTRRLHRIDFYIPYEGSPELLDFHPSQWQMGGVDASTARDSVVISVTAEGDDPKKVERAYLDRLAQVTSHADRSNSEVQMWRKHARESLRTTAASRRKHLDQMQTMSDGLAIPLQSSRKPVVSIPIAPTTVTVERRTGTAGQVPEPTLPVDVAEIVVSRIVGFGHALERLPLTASKFSETELRDVLLFILNSNFEGLARAEAFNGNGKTDILLPWQDRNAFIGECKFWDGPAKFVDALNQLLSYLVWRDTRATLILFIRESDATAIIAKCDTAIRAHSQHLRAHPVDDPDGPRRFTFTSPMDGDRAIELVFIPFVILTPPKLSRTE